MSVSFLQERLVLKGGTALNLFCYIGALDGEKMLEEKPIIIDAIQQIMSKNR